MTSITLIEGARRNYNGDPALSWQTLWAGPFLLDQELGGFGGVAECQEALVGEHSGLWEGGGSPISSRTALQRGSQRPRPAPPALPGANRRKLKLCVPAGLLNWWRLFLAKFVPRRKRGEGTDEAYWPVLNE